MKCPAHAGREKRLKKKRQRHLNDRRDLYLPLGGKDVAGAVYFRSFRFFQSRNRMRGASRIDSESESSEASRLTALASMCAAVAALDVSASRIRCVPDGT